MAREHRRLLIPPPRLAERIVLTAGERHYLTRVLRLTVGQGCDVVDGEGRRWSARLAADDRLELAQPLAAPLEREPPPAPALELAVALPRQDVEMIWRMATELGVDRLQPLLADRCQVRERWALERWRTIVREASEQCERLWLPVLAEPVQAAAWLAAPGGAEAPSSPLASAGPSEQVGEGLNLLASSRGAALPLLPQVLAGFPAPALPDPSGAPGETSRPGAGAWRVRVAIGPEGGWSPAEEATALAQGWLAVSAGPTILRTSTAAVAVAAWLSGWRAALSSSSSLWRSP